MGPEDVEIEGLMDNGSDDLTPEQAYSLRQSLWELFRVLLAAAVLPGLPGPGQLHGAHPSRRGLHPGENSGL